MPHFKITTDTSHIEYIPESQYESESSCLNIKSQNAFTGTQFSVKDQAGFLWPAALPLCNWLTKERVSGKNVLELGAGVGLVAAYMLKALKPAHVFVTEYDQKHLALIEENLASNSLSDTNWVSLDVLDWNKPSESALNKRLPSLDVIVGSDLFFDEVSADALVSCLAYIKSCVGKKRKLDIYIAAVERSPYLMEYFEELVLESDGVNLTEKYALAHVPNTQPVCVYHLN